MGRYLISSKFSAFKSEDSCKKSGMVISISDLSSSCIIGEYVCASCGKAHLVIDNSDDKNTLLSLAKQYKSAMRHVNVVKASEVDKTVKVPKTVPAKVYVDDVCSCQADETLKSTSRLKYYKQLISSDTDTDVLYRFMVELDSESSASSKVLALCPSSVVSGHRCARGQVGDDVFNFLRGFKADMDVVPCRYNGMNAFMIHKITSKNRVYKVIQDNDFVKALKDKRSKVLSENADFTIDRLDSLFETQLYDLRVPKVMILLCGLTVDTLPNREKGSVSVINNDGRGFCVFYGDGGTAKSSLLEAYELRFLKDTNGQLMSGETATMVGITGGIDTTSPTGAYITEGALTKANKAILLVDGGQQMRGFISKMRECFTKGVIQIRKMLSGDLPARTRIMLAYNLRKNMGGYGSYISAMKDIGSSKQEKAGALSTPDIRRFDMFYPFIFTGKKHKRKDSATSRDFIRYYRDLLVIAWTVKPEDISVEDIDFDLMDRTVDSLTDDYGALIDYAILNSTKHITFLKYVVASAILNGRVRFEDGRVKVILDNADIRSVHQLFEEIIIANRIYTIKAGEDIDNDIIDGIISLMTKTQRKHLEGVYATSSTRIETYASDMKISRQAVSKVFRQNLVSDIVVDGAEFPYSLMKGAYDGDNTILPPIYSRGITAFGQKVCERMAQMTSELVPVMSSAVAGSGKVIKEGSRLDEAVQDKMNSPEKVDAYIEHVLVSSLKRSPMTYTNILGLVYLNRYSDKLISTRLTALINKNVVDVNRYGEVPMFFIPVELES
ncbi:hypothetical protein GQ472_00655 [archaeon]|nr:hypothetical protein [archaeon]